MRIGDIVEIAITSQQQVWTTNAAKPYHTNRCFHMYMYTTQQQQQQQQQQQPQQQVKSTFKPP